MPSMPLKFWNDPRVQKQVNNAEEFVKDKAPEVAEFLSDGAKKVLGSFKRRSDDYKFRGMHLIVFRCSRCRYFHNGNSRNDLNVPDRVRKRKGKSRRRRARKENRIRR